MAWKDPDEAKKYWAEYRKRPEVIARRKAKAKERYEKEQKNNPEELQRVREREREKARQRATSTIRDLMGTEPKENKDE